MKTIIYSLLTVLISVAICSCQKDSGWRQPLGNDTTKPAVVTDVKVENLNGKSKISYTLPKDENLLYVKAVYTMSNGQQGEAKSTYYSNFLMVDGFADTNEHEVTLYTVSRSNISSDPVTAKIKPLEAPIWQVLKSIDVENAFGGYNLKAKNPTKSDIAILVLKKNEFNEWEIDNNKSIYTNGDSILSKIRALDTITYTFPILVRDRWGNKTDTLYKVVKPIYETEFSKANFRGLVLPNDALQVTNGARLEYAWDNRFGWPYTSFTDQNRTGPQPHMVTIDLGATGKLSRVWIKPFPEGTRYYFLSTMKRFEIWGSVSPNLNGNLDNSWVLLGSYDVVKPSGLPYGTDNNLDQETASAGFDWDIDLNAPKVRYIRIRCLENFAGGTAQSINELSVFGDNR